MSHDRGYDVSPPLEQWTTTFTATCRFHEPHHRDLVDEVAAEITELATVTREEARRSWECIAPYFWWVDDPDQMAADEITRTLDEITDLVVHGINLVPHQVTSRSATATSQYH